MRSEAAVAEETKDEVKPKVDREAALLEILGRLSERQDEGPIKQVPVARALYRTPWNPTGKKNRPKLKRATYLNGFRLREMRLTEENIALLNKVKAGKYQDRKWVVVESDGDSEDGGASVNIWIPNKTVQDRLKLANKSAGRGLAALLELIVEEQSKVVLA